MALRELALFAGCGGGILGGMLLGWRTVCAVEIEDYPRRILLQRQADGILPRFPIWDDIKTFDGKPWRGKVDVVSGGFPCTNISVAGKGEGLDGEQSSLWWEMHRIIGEVRPRFAFVENSPALIVRGLPRILGALSELGYDTRWGIVSAADTGARHLRKRIWILAYINGLDDDDSRHGASEVFWNRSEETELCGCEVTSNFNGVWELQQERLKREIGGWSGDSNQEATDIMRKRRHKRMYVEQAGKNRSEKRGKFTSSNRWNVEPRVV